MRPKRVYWSTTNAIARMTRATTPEVDRYQSGLNLIRLDAIHLMVGSSIGIEASLITNDAPRAKNIAPRVAMNGWISKSRTRIPTP